MAPDGHNGLWIPLSTPAGGTIASFMHYSGGHLSLTKLPVASDKIDLQAVAGIPGTAGAIAVGFTHSASNLGSAVVGVILQQGGRSAGRQPRVWRLPAQASGSALAAAPFVLPAAARPGPESAAGRFLLLSPMAG